MIRPAVPILTVIDDGSVDEGEQIRIRKDSFVIGRSSGDLTSPNNATMSGRHAEITLTVSRGQREWTLHTLESVNGTFVRVGTAALADETIIILKSRRFRLQKPALKEPDQNGDDIFRIDQHADSRQLWPTLAESSGKPNSLRFPLRADRPADPPASHGIRLAHSRDDDRAGLEAGPECRKRHRLRSIEDQLVGDLVGDDGQIGLDGDVGQGPQSVG